MRRRSLFFPVAAALVALIPLPAYLVAHALLMTAWLLLFGAWVFSLA